MEEFGAMAIKALRCYKQNLVGHFDWRLEPKKAQIMQTVVACLVSFQTGTKTPLGTGLEIIHVPFWQLICILRIS